MTNHDKLIALQFGVMSLLYKDEESMVKGFNFLVDFEGFTIKHQTFFGLDDIRKVTDMWAVSTEINLCRVVHRSWGEAVAIKKHRL